VNIVLANWIVWGVLELQNVHYMIFYWIVIRLVSRLQKHIYNIYINMGMRFELIWLDYFRFTSFYLMLPLEVLWSYVVIYNLFDYIKTNGTVWYTIPEINFDLDNSLLAFFYVCVSIPSKLLYLLIYS
jgi:hypothetical protein